MRWWRENMFLVRGVGKLLTPIGSGGGASIERRRTWLIMLKPIVVAPSCYHVNH